MYEFTLKISRTLGAASRLNPLLNVVVMTLCAVISGADDFVAIAKWSRKNEAWLARYLDVSKGIPSHDRFNTIFGAINPREFETCLLSWITSLHEITSGQVVAIEVLREMKCASQVK